MADPARPVAVVVVNYGSHRLLEANLHLLAGAGTHVLVVDNETTAAERAAVHALAADRGWEVLAGDGNPGFGAAVNLAAARAAELGCGVLVLLNPDAMIDPETLAALADRVTRDPDLVTTPRIVDGSGATWFAGSWLNLRDGRIRRHPPAGGDWTPWLTGACLALDLALFGRIGGFADDYFLYWEDVDLSYRAGRAGARLQVSDDLVVVHDEGGTHGRTDGPDAGRVKSPLYYRYNTRNRLVFAAHHLDGAALWRWVRATPRVSYEILLRGGRRQLVRSPRPLWSALRGSVEGLAFVVAATRRRRRVRGSRQQ